MDRSGDIQQGDHVGRKHIQTGLLAQACQRWRRFLARLDSARHCIREYSHRLGRYSSQKSTNTRPRQRGASSEILAARRSNRDSHLQRICPSLGQQRWPLARAHPSRSSHGVQQGSALVQQPPLCRIRQCNQEIGSIHRVNSLRMASSRYQRSLVHRPSKACGIHRVFYTKYRHVLGHINAHPARSHPTPSIHRLDCTLTRRPVSRNWWKWQEDHRQKSISHYRQYRWRTLIFPNRI